MNSPWQIRRKQPYTEIGLKRLKCIRCGEPPYGQWQICSEGNNYRPLCTGCDIKLNRMVLKFMKHPHAEQLAAEYKSDVE
jgi:hypothetical protein